MPDTKDFQSAVRLEQSLWDDMQQNAKTWSLIGEFVYPWRNQAIASETKADATRRSTKIINGAAGLAFNAFRAGMLSGNSSPSQRWFKIGAIDPKTGLPIDDQEARVFFNALEGSVYRDLSQSNAYRSLSLCYGDQGLYGTSAMLVIADTEDPLRCYVFPIGSYGIGQDWRGVPDKFCRRFKMTAEQMISAFGIENVSAKVRAAATRQGSQYNQEFDVTHLIAPNATYRETASVAKYKRFKECYWESGKIEGQSYLRESGYDNFPVVVTRWSPAGGSTPWGVGPGLEILGDVMQLQMIARDVSNAVEYEVNPAMQGPGSLQSAWVKRRPGAFTAIDITQGQSPLQRLFDPNLRLDHAQMLMAECITRINEALFKDLFKQFTGMGETLPKTAYLAQRMFQEKAGNLLPAMEQQYDELLSKLLDRVIQIQIETGKLDPATFPDSLQDEPSIKYDYISPFAEAQRAQRTGGVETFLGLVGQATSVWPEARNKIDIYEAIEELGDGYSVPPQIVRSAEATAEIDAAQAEAMRRQQVAAAVPGAAKATKDLSFASLGEGNALEAIVGVPAA